MGESAIGESLSFRDDEIGMDVHNRRVWRFTLHYLRVLDGFNSMTNVSIVNVKRDDHFLATPPAWKAVRLVLFLSHADPHDVRLVASHAFEG